MKTLGSIIFIHAVSLATAGIIIPSSKIIEGPSSKTTLVGPDGSVITSVQQGAKIVTDGHSALVSAPDTEAILKEAEVVPVVETKLEPLISIKSGLTPVAAVETFVPHGVPIQGIEAHVPIHTAYLKSEPVLTQHVGTKTTISEHSQSIAHPVQLVKSNLAPIVSPVIEAKAHLEPIIETRAVPAVATKTTVSDYSQAIAHHTTVGQSVEPLHLTKLAHYVAPAISVETRHVAPAPAVRIEAHNVAPALAVETYHGPTLAAETRYAAPALVGYHTASALALETNHAARAALEAHHAAPVLSVGTYHAAPAFTVQSYHAAPSVDSHHVAPVLLKQVAPIVPVIGTKTTISENSQSVVHPVEAKAIISESTPVVTANLVNEHAIPVAARHAIPVIGTETRISENAQTLVSHSW